MKERRFARMICATLIAASLVIYLSIGPSGILFSQDLTPRAYLASLFLAEATPTPTVTPTATVTPTPTATAPTPPPSGDNRSLRFFGNGVAAPQQDRVEIALGNPARPVNVGNGDFTLEFWMKANLGDNNNGHTCGAGNDDWINAHIIFDRDVFGGGDYGDYGISLASGRIAFGVNNGSSGATLCGSTNVANGQWHHIAVQRRSSDGQLWIFVDGQLDGQLNGPDGRIDYRVGRSGAANDPFLVIGAEKHDAGAAYPSYNGFVDEARISTVLRYSGNFTRPSGPFASDGNTTALYHFNEPSGMTITDSSGASGGPSNGVMNVGGNPSGPLRSTDVPF